MTEGVVIRRGEQRKFERAEVADLQIPLRLFRCGYSAREKQVSGEEQRQLPAIREPGLCAGPLRYGRVMPGKPELELFEAIILGFLRRRTAQVGIPQVGHRTNDQRGGSRHIPDDNDFLLIPRCGSVAIQVLHGSDDVGMQMGEHHSRRIQ